MHSGDKASPLIYFTFLVGEHCSHMMINRTLEHVHHYVLVMHHNYLIINMCIIITSVREERANLSAVVYL